MVVEKDGESERVRDPETKLMLAEHERSSHARKCRSNAAAALRGEARRDHDYVINLLLHLTTT
jgi:hypothetical protein